MACVADDDDEWWEELLDEVRQLTLGDFEDADDPCYLLDLLPGIVVNRWLPRPDSEHCWYAVLQTRAGWIGVYFGTMQVGEDDYATWGRDWTMRLPLFVGAVTCPLAGPSPDPEALAMELAGLPRPEAIDSGWHEGMLLLLLLDALEPAERTSHQVLLGLGYEEIVAAVNELANRIANKDRLEEARQALAAAFTAAHPEVGKIYTTPRDAEALLAYSYAEWPQAAKAVVAEMLDEPSSNFSLLLRRRSSETGA